MVSLRVPLSELSMLTVDCTSCCRCFAWQFRVLHKYIHANCASEQPTVTALGCIKRL